MKNIQKWLIKSILYILVTPLVIVMVLKEKLDELECKLNKT